MLKLSGRFRASRKDKSAFGEQEANLVVQQISRDATYGSFGEFPDGYWKSNERQLRDEFEQRRREMVRIEALDRVADEWKFVICLDEGLFSPGNGGLQHLVGVVAGDLFAMSISGFEIENLRFTEIDWGDLLHSAVREFRATAFTIDQVREAFGLNRSAPLVAFTFKPRIGVPFEKIRSVTLEVLDAGFQLVELDTRNLDSRDEFIEKLVSLAAEAASVGKKRGRVTRFAPNLSLAGPRLVELAQKFSDITAPPWTIKIDGGLDGVSGIQLIRQAFRENPPIITCYPLLTHSLASYLPNYGFTDLLAASGADVVYMGGCPQFEDEGFRNLSKTRLFSGLDRYKISVERRWPMPTVAGGVHAGQIHAYYELLGPDVAYFIGGGVALHNTGPAHGANLCMRGVREAVRIREAVGFGRLASDSEDDQVVGSQDEYMVPRWMPADRFQYLSPQQLFDEYPGLADRCWFMRPDK